MVVSGARVEGGPHIVSAGVRKTIQSIKEIVGNHSDAEIYVALKDANMDPNETAQKLLNQDPFHEVKRKRDKKKENMGYRGFEVQRKHSENVGQVVKVRTFSDRNVRRGGYTRNALPGISREFRVVRDNRVNGNTSGETKPASPQCSPSINEQVISDVSDKGSTGTSTSHKPLGRRNSPQAFSEPTDLHSRHARDVNLSGTYRKEVLGENRATFSKTGSHVQGVKPNSSQQLSATLPSSNSVIGVYSSATDPVHVPSPDSRASANVGAIKREVGVVGVRRQSSENAVKHPFVPSSSLPNSLSGTDSSTESFQPFTAISKSDQTSQTAATESEMPSVPVSRSFLGNQYGGRLHQQVAGHQKASQPSKEWKPKLSQKSSTISPGVIGTPSKSVSPPVDNSELVSEAAKLEDKLSQVNIYQNGNVIIAQHIRVPDTDRCQLTFGSFGMDIDYGVQALRGTEESNGEHAASFSVSAPESLGDDASGSQHIDLLDDQAQNSESDSPASGAESEFQLPDKKESSSPHSSDNYADIGMVRGSSPSYVALELQQHQDPPELSSFSAYDPQTGYDIPYFRPTMDDTVRGQVLPSPQEALNSHTVNGIPSSTIAMVQQQQQQQQPAVAQMYPQVHVSHFANLMPYRQFISPVYVPPMAIPGYSNSPAYPHPSNGSSYLLMPGGSSHLSANGLKYGLQQYKPVPTGSPSGFGNYTNSTGYAMNAPGIVGSATGLEDSSRIKYKDANLYVPNPQAETSEIWIQNPREVPGLQSNPYYNMQAQTPHAAYLPSHTGHASFNAAAAQSSHMQFPGMYHPSPQPAAIANPHHLGPAMGGNVGVGMAAAAPGAQVGAYQQSQLGHLNWAGNF